MFIHTVYRPEENVDYLEDWLTHHIAIGVKHFYLYDNGGAQDIKGQGYSEDMFSYIQPNTNQYGIPFKYTVEEARNIQDKIFKNFPVTVIPWQNKNDQGKLLYNHKESVLHFKSFINDGLCAFIDIDEFIIKKEEFNVCRMYQKKFKSRHYYNSVHDCFEIFDITVPFWGPKVILDMANFPENFVDMHFRNFNLPISKSYFNHYNYNDIAHKYFLEVVLPLIPSESRPQHNLEYSKIFSTIQDTGLIKSFK